MKRLLAIAVLTLAAASLTLAGGPPARAWSDPDPIPNVPIKKNFATEATLSADGLQVTLTGEIGLCEPREQTAEIQATVLQSASGASATGVTQEACPRGELVSFTVVVTVPAAKPAFEAGPAQVCGLAISRNGQDRHIVDIESWCTFVTLVQP